MVLPRLPVSGEDDQQQAALLQHSVTLGQRRRDVLHVLEDVERQDRVESLVRKGQRFSATDVEVGRHVSCFGEQPRGIDVDL